MLGMEGPWDLPSWAHSLPPPPSQKEVPVQEEATHPRTPTKGRFPSRVPAACGISKTPSPETNWLLSATLKDAERARVARETGCQGVLAWTCCLEGLSRSWLRVTAEGLPAEGPREPAAPGRPGAATTTPLCRQAPQSSAAQPCAAPARVPAGTQERGGRDCQQTQWGSSALTQEESGPDIPLAHRMPGPAPL